MQDFMFGNIKKQDAVPEPYTLYNKEQQSGETEPQKGMLKDIEYFRSMYPVRVKGLQLLVEEVCDEMDYQGSPMYDEYPDRMTVEQLFRKVSKKASEKASEKAPGAEQETKAFEQGTNEVEEVEIYEAARPLKAVYTEVKTKENCIPHMPYGPEYMIQTVAAPRGSYQIWEMDETTVKEEQLTPRREQGEPRLQQIEQLQGMELVGASRPWGPSCPGCQPPPQWGPPPHPWGPPPPHPWGPPPPHPWGPPPPPRPWGPPLPPWGPANMDDIIRLLLFGEMQKRRCSNGFCR